MNTKYLADKRCDELAREPLWPNAPIDDNAPSAQLTLSWPNIRFGDDETPAQQALAQANIETDGAFDFWVTWYDQLLAGTLPDQNLLQWLAGTDDAFWSLAPRP